MKPIQEWRIGTLIALTALTMSFILALVLKDATPFTATSPFAVGGKYLENWQERRKAKHSETEPE